MATMQLKKNCWSMCGTKDPDVTCVIWILFFWKLYSRHIGSTFYLIRHWYNIPQAFIQRLIGSMRRRCEVAVAARGGHTRYWTPQTPILHDNLCLSMICSDNDVETFCWYCLICYAHMNVNYTIFVLYVRNIEHQTLVSFLFLTSKYMFVC
jgi:hypothetical protein